MKKSNQVILTAILLLAITACKEEQDSEDEWTDGKDQYGNTRDTTIHDGTNVYHYRYFGGGWYPVIGGLISMSRYHPATAYDISRPGFTAQTRARPATGFRRGGFGSSAHHTAAS